MTEKEEEARLDMIETENLTRKFGDLTAVDNLTLRVDEGEVFGFLGPNGAGKTTTVRMLCCLISKTSGSARVGEFDVGKEEDALKIRRIVGFVPDNVGLYDSLTAYENLDYYGTLYRRTDSQRKESNEYFLKMLGLWEKRDTMAGTFSKGMKQKLAIARALVHDPEVIFMDEPTANLDPEASKGVREFILELKREKKTIFLNTHNLDEAERVCDRIGIMNTKLMAVGTPEELERSVRGRRTEIQLRQVTDAILDSLKKLKLRNLVREGNKLTVDVVNPEEENPDMVSAIVGAGGRVESVTVAGSTLEDAYLKLVRDAP
ncbi:MAG: ABC transporter ATP-binding protein [Thaumarchaeota archaeon]|nr:ABC transporter ATP-binding protein [Nitrososphaerota archaeon]